MTQRFTSESVAATESIGRALAERLTPDAVVLLEGDLGAGKTVLVRGLAAGLGIDPAAIQSPTFAIVHEHSLPRRLVHVDLYRLAAEEAEAIGIDELLAGPGIKAVEWAERLPAPPPAPIRVVLTRVDGRCEIALDGIGEPLRIPVLEGGQDAFA